MNLKNPERRLPEKIKITTNIITLIILIGTIISGAILYGANQSTLRNDINSNNEEIIKIESRTNILEINRTEDQKIQTEMNTNIKWIMQNIEEIKELLK